MSLTDTAIRNARPGAKPKRLFDGRGLYLEVSPSGGRLWRVKYRHAGKEKRLALGTYPDVALKEAREKRDAARKLLAQGVDPGAVRKAEKATRQRQAENSFEAVAREWVDQNLGRWTPGHAAQVLRTLEVHMFPAIGVLPIDEVVPAQLLQAVRQIEARGLGETPARVLQRTAAVFRYAVLTGRRLHSPATEMRGVLKGRTVTHRAALKAEELPEFLRKLEAYDGAPETRLGLKLLMLTMVRAGELRAARWEEFDTDAALWRIPTERMKTRAPHLVPLAPQTLAVLEDLRPFTGHRALVFPGRNNPTRPMSENTLLYALYRMGYHGRATGHGFRATASAILNEHGFRPDVIERQLAHAERNKVRAAYHRSEYLDDRRRMMQWWADHLDVLWAGGAVLPFKCA